MFKHTFSTERCVKVTQSAEIAFMSIVDRWVDRESARFPRHPRKAVEKAVYKIMSTLIEEAGSGAYPALVRQIDSGELNLDVFDIGDHLNEEGS